MQKKIRAKDAIPINATSHCCALVRTLSTSKNELDFDNIVKNFTRSWTKKALSPLLQRGLHSGDP